MGFFIHFDGVVGTTFLFPRQGVNDYVIIRGTMPRLSSLTACLWMKATDVNEGTPLGYAVPDQSNEFIIYNYNSFMLFIGGKYRSVKMPITKCKDKNVYSGDRCLLNGLLSLQSFLDISVLQAKTFEDLAGISLGQGFSLDLGS